MNVLVNTFKGEKMLVHWSSGEKHQTKSSVIFQPKLVSSEAGEIHVAYWRYLVKTNVLIPGMLPGKLQKLALHFKDKTILAEKRMSDS